MFRSAFQLEGSLAGQFLKAVMTACTLCVASRSFRAEGPVQALKFLATHFLQLIWFSPNLTYCYVCRAVLSTSLTSSAVLLVPSG